MGFFRGAEGVCGVVLDGVSAICGRWLGFGGPERGGEDPSPLIIPKTFKSIYSDSLST